MSDDRPDRRPRSAGARVLLVASLALALCGLATNFGAATPRLLLAVVVIVAASRALGALFRTLRQPMVVGEMAAGILLGPVLLGRFAPGVVEAVLPASVRPSLGAVAQLCVLIYMFLVGVEFDASLLRRQSRASATVAFTSLALPFALGVALAFVVGPSVGAPSLTFALFIGVAMSVTAFPVLARIVAECGLRGTPVGSLAMACAAVADAAAWCVLAAVVSLARPDAHRLPVVLVSFGLYLVAANFVMRPLGRALAALWERSRWVALPAVLALLVASAWATDAAGVHAIFGAFAAGLVIPHGSRLARDLREGLDDAVVVLLPTFFASAGLRMQAGALSAASFGALLGAVIVVASVGKLAGGALGARVAGMAWRDALAVGALMNTRGLMELVVLQVGLDLGIISSRLFAVMVLMALATTLMTTPAVRWLLRPAPGGPAAG